MPDDDRVRSLFASLREAEQEPTPPAAPAPARGRPPTAESTDAEREPEPEVSDSGDSPGESSPDTSAETGGDAALRAARDELVDGLVARTTRDAKRLLQDAQNELLDATRRARARIDPTRLLPEPDAARDAWAEVLGGAIDAAYNAGRALAGRKARAGGAPQRLIDQLAGDAAVPLRDRLGLAMAAVASEGPYESTNELHRALAIAIGARYREFKQRDLEPLLGDLFAAAYARGAYEATPSGALLRWMPAATGQCADCDDNALEPTVKGQSFPTGQLCPPAHPGCRCVAVPLDD